MWTFKVKKFQLCLSEDIIGTRFGVNICQLAQYNVCLTSENCFRHNICVRRCILDFRGLETRHEMATSLSEDLSLSEGVSSCIMKCQAMCLTLLWLPEPPCSCDLASGVNWNARFLGIGGTADAMAVVLAVSLFVDDLDGVSSVTCNLTSRGRICC